jgi:hypothetical protein
MLTKKEENQLLVFERKVTGTPNQPIKSNIFPEKLFLVPEK